MRIIVVFLILLSSVAEATHLRSGFITIRRASAVSLTCEVTVTIYVNTGSEIEFGDGLLDFGDGNWMATPTIHAVLRPDLGPFVGEVVYSVMHDYNVPGRYIVGYLEANRNAGVINMFSSVETRFYTESLIDLNVVNPPVMHFVAPAVFKATAGTKFTLGLGVAAESDYRFQYILAVPQKEAGLQVNNYWLPDGVSLNPFNGELTWDTENHPPRFSGEYSFAVRIEAYDSSGHFVGYVIFDFQVILLDGGSPGGRISFGRDLGDKGRVFTDTQDSVKVIFEADRSDWAMNLYDQLPDEAVSMTTKDSTANGKFYKVCWVKFNNMESIRRVNPHVVIVRASLADTDHHTYDITSLFFTTDIDFTDVITGVEKNTPHDLRLFPNPFNRFLNIEGTGSGGGTISLFKLTGEHIVTLKWTEGQPLDLSELPSGFYIARINGQAFRIVKRYREP